MLLFNLGFYRLICSLVQQLSVISWTETLSRVGNLVPAVKENCSCCPSCLLTPSSPYESFSLLLGYFQGLLNLVSLLRTGPDPGTAAQTKLRDSHSTLRASNIVKNTQYQLSLAIKQTSQKLTFSLVLRTIKETQTCSPISFLSAQRHLWRSANLLSSTLSPSDVSAYPLHPSQLLQLRLISGSKNVSYKIILLFSWTSFFLLPWLNQKNTILFCRIIFLLG